MGWPSVGEMMSVTRELDVVFLEIFRALDDSLGDFDDLRHEIAARKFAVLHLAQLVFPFAGHVRLGEDVGVDRGKKLEKRFRLRRRNELALLAAPDISD